MSDIRGSAAKTVTAEQASITNAKRIEIKYFAFICIELLLFSRLIANKTVMIIAHRMRTVAGADKIVVLAEGTVAEQGTPEKLSRENGLYSHMVKLQTESRDWVL